MTTTFHRHWRDVPESAWRWPNFSPAEIACRGTGKLLINEVALDKLQALRDRLGKPLIVRSAHSSPEQNRAVGGATRSPNEFVAPDPISPTGMSTPAGAGRHWMARSDATLIGAAFLIG